MPFQIIDIKKYSLRDEDFWVLAEIETHPKVRELDTNIHVTDKSKTYRLFKEFSEALPGNKNQIFLVGKLDGKVIGFLGVHRKTKRMKHVGMIGITIHPDYWNKGFGTKILKAGIEHARKHKFLRLEVDSLAKNKAIIKIAEKVGFKLEGIRRMRINMGEKYEDEALLSMILAQQDAQQVNKQP